MALGIQDITELFHTHGATQYGLEMVTQQQHALQCAHLAEQAGASAELVAAALLHDLGHLLPTRDRPRAANGDDLHQYLALAQLRHTFPEAVLAPIRLHVDAKRYLCHADGGYWASLSPASQRSLALQGGPFSAQEAAAFRKLPYSADAQALRRWDDGGKNPAAITPGWRHYVAILEKASGLPAVLPAESFSRQISAAGAFC